VEDVKKALSERGLEPERIMFQPMVLPIFKVLPKFISDFTDKVKALGRIPDDKRKTIA
jgi:coenzyme F420-reducing hydrogenase delta subunit